MGSISWIACPETESWWDLASQVMTALVAISVFGESISHIVPVKWLPASIRSKERIDEIAKVSTWALVIALVLEVPIGIARDRIAAMKGATLATTLRDTQAALENERISHLPRSISADKRLSVIECLRGGVRGPVYVRPAMFDAEAKQWGDVLRDIFNEANFDIKQFPQDSISWSIPGTFMILTRLENAPMHAVTIQKCFKSINIDILGYPDEKHPEDEVSIAIGARH